MTCESRIVVTDDPAQALVVRAMSDDLASALTAMFDAWCALAGDQLALRAQGGQAARPRPAAVEGGRPRTYDCPVAEAMTNETQRR